MTRARSPKKGWQWRPKGLPRRGWSCCPREAARSRASGVLSYGSSVGNTTSSGSGTPASTWSSGSGLVVFLGLLGGVAAFGFVGLILGPIVLMVAGTLLDAFAED